MNIYKNINRKKKFISIFLLLVLIMTYLLQNFSLITANALEVNEKENVEMSNDITNSLLILIIWMIPIHRKKIT